MSEAKFTGRLVNKAALGTSIAAASSENGNSSAIPATAPQYCFATTHWSVVTAASGKDSLSTQAALGALCQTYWYPLYAHVRRRGYDAETARDLTQGFFAKLIANDSIAQANSNRGRPAQVAGFCSLRPDHMT